MDTVFEASTSNPPPVIDESSEEPSDETLSPEMLQRKLYFLLEHLKQMHSELPE